VIDRIPFSPDKPDEPGGTVDCVYLDNVVSYPIIRGRSNPAFARSSSHTALETQTTKLLIPSETISETVAYSAEALASSEHLVAIPETTLIGKRGLQPLLNWTSASDISHEASLNAKRLRAQATAAAEYEEHNYWSSSPRTKEGCHHKRSNYQAALGHRGFFHNRRMVFWSYPRSLLGSSRH